MARVVDIGASLGAARRALGMTQGDLAMRLGVKRQQIQRWESGAYRMASLENVGRVADALGWDSARVPIVAEAPAAYGDGRPVTSDAVRPVRDLGEVARRVRHAGDQLGERFGVRSVSVFGSFARGDQSPASDVDILLELDDPSLESQFGAERELERILCRQVETGTARSVNRRVRANVLAEAVRVWPA